MTTDPRQPAEDRRTATNSPPMDPEPTPTPIGRLSDEEREALKASLAVRVDFTDEDGNADYITQVGHLANVLPAVERIVRAHAERAWDEALAEVDRRIDQSGVRNDSAERWGLITAQRIIRDIRDARQEQDR